MLGNDSRVVLVQAVDDLLRGEVGWWILQDDCVDEGFAPEGESHLDSLVGEHVHEYLVASFFGYDVEDLPDGRWEGKDVFGHKLFQGIFGVGVSFEVFEQGFGWNWVVFLVGGDQNLVNVLPLFHDVRFIRILFLLKGGVAGEDVNSWGQNLKDLGEGGYESSLGGGIAYSQSWIHGQFDSSSVGGFIGLERQEEHVRISNSRVEVDGNFIFGLSVETGDEEIRLNVDSLGIFLCGDFSIYDSHWQILVVDFGLVDFAVGGASLNDGVVDGSNVGGGDCEIDAIWTEGYFLEGVDCWFVLGGFGGGICDDGFADVDGVYGLVGETKEHGVLDCCFVYGYFCWVVDRGVC